MRINSSENKKIRNKITVLVTGMGATTAISIIKGLRKQHAIPIKIIGVDINKKNSIAGSTFCDKYYQVPYAVDKKYIPALLSVCRREKVNILFPVVDIELTVISKHLDDFRKLEVKVWLSEPETIRICNDKYLTYKFFKENGFPTAQTYLPAEKEQLRKAALPLIIKPRDGVSSIDVFKITQRSEISTYSKRVKNAIIQECLQGKEYTIDVLCDEKSKVLAVVPRERIETKSGISTKGVTVHSPLLIKMATKIAERLGIIGGCNIQCIIDKKGNVKFFEVNPRFSGTLPLTIKAGVNSPCILLKKSIGQQIKKHYAFKPGVFMVRYWQEIYYEK